MSKGEKPMVGARVPQAWMDQIQRICQETGKSTSDVVKEALAEYLGHTDIDSVQSLHKRIAAIELEMQKLVDR